MTLVDINNKYFSKYKRISVHIDYDESGVNSIPLCRIISVALF